jgi:hypothetical protein
LPADPIEQPLFGAVGALVIEPLNATWQTDPGTTAAATVFAPPRQAFRDFVGIWQTQIDCAFSPPSPNCQTSQSPTPQYVQLLEALNYRGEPLPFRVGTDSDISNAYSNTLESSQPHVLTADPQTPVFWASSGMPLRFRFVNPGGQLAVTEVFGHHWEEEPWQNGSTRIGDNPLSQTMGAVVLGTSHTLNLVVAHAGVPGDYLYRNFVDNLGSFPDTESYAMWGLLRVGPRASDVLVLTSYQRDSGGGAVLSGYVTPDMQTQHYATQVAVVGGTDKATVDPSTGRFQITLKDQPAIVTVRSTNGGQASAALPAAAAVVAMVRAAPSNAEAVAATQARRQRHNLLVTKYLPRRIAQRPALQ